MAKKRKTRASQPSEDQPPVDNQPTTNAVVKQEDPEPPVKEEPFEDNPNQQADNEEEEHEEVEEEEDDDDDEDPEEQNDDETTQNDTKEVKLEPKEEELTNLNDSLSDEPVEKLLEPFSKEQLVVLMKEAVSKFPDLITSVNKIADADPAHRKIFVHGLGWDTTTETLISEYSKYGEIEDCKAVVDKTTGKSKGYGFILFKHRTGARKALKEPQKKIGNRITSCQLASAGPVPAPPPNAPAVSEYTQRKIFVSNVAADIDPQKLTEFFGKYGEIEEGPLGLDKQTGKPKGFALFVYKSVESAKKALEEPHKVFEGHTLNCQKAVDGPKPVKGGFGQHGQQFGGHHHQAKKAKYSGVRGGVGQGHMMAASGPPVGGFSQPPIPPPGALTPVLGQALTALLASQGAGLGIGNLLGGLGAPGNPQGMPHNPAYGGQGGAGYQQGGYANPQMGQGGSRPQQGGGSYMGQGH